jgi:hypothetical protein
MKSSVTRTIAGSGASNSSSADHGMSALSPIDSAFGAVVAPDRVTPPAATLRILGCSPRANRSFSPLPSTMRLIANSSHEAIVPDVGAARTSSGGPSSQRMERSDSSTWSLRGTPSSPMRPQS